MIDLAVRPDAPAMTVDDAVDRGQADTGAAEFFGVMETLEETEKLMGVSHIEASPVITDKESDFACIQILAATEFDAWLRCFTCEFPGVS